MKKIFIAIIICLIISPFFAFAYKLLQPLPGLGEEVAAKGGFTAYLSWIFRFALAAAAFLAVLQIVIGGIQYIISGASESLRKSAHDKITNALWGVLLALAAWLILYTINPDLAKMKLEIPEINIKAVPIESQIDRGEFAEAYKDRINAAFARAQFAEFEIGVKSECQPGVSEGCVKSEGLRQSTIDELKNLREQCPGTQIYVTGGTESGHSSGVTSHSNGYKVDLGLNTELDKCIKENFKPARIRTDGAKQWINSKTGAVYALELGKKPHWDIKRQ